MKNLIIGYLSFVLLTLTSCALLGIHINVHNPKKAAEFPTFTKEQILLGEMTALRSCYDVHYYDLSLNILPSQKRLEGIVQIHATAQTDFEQLQIDLHPNFSITKLADMESGKILSYTRSERAVFVNCSKKAGANFIIEVAYEGKPLKAKKAPWKGGFVWKKDKQGEPWIGVACESDGASLWWALKDHTADEPDSIRMHYSVPEHLTAVGNGQFEGKTVNESTITYNWFVSYPINTYNITLYVGKFKKITDTFEGINGQSLDLSHYVLQENYEQAKKHFKQLHPILRTFEQKFGAYPWYRDGFKLVESPYAGMEHQTAIAYGNGYKNDLDSETDYIILHETAHEWWGNSLTAKDLADVWLHEGFATYAEALYLEEKNGRVAYENKILFDQYFIKNKYPIVGVKDRRWFHYKKSADVYIKGASVLHSLRSQIDNDSLFFHIIRSFAENYKYEIIESKHFIDWVNEKTGDDYNWFFDHFLYKNEAPELEDFYIDGFYYYRWKNVDQNFNKLKLKFSLSNGKNITLIPTQEVQAIKIFDIEKEEEPILISFESNVFIAFDENKELLSDFEN